MGESAPSPTILLQRLREGDDSASGLLFDQLYPELHLIAQRIFRSQNTGHTLQPTVLVHEAYMKMIGTDAPSWESRAHFCNVAARAMRQILINHARDKSAAKRGGPDAHRVTLHDGDGSGDEAALDLLALDEALTQLEQVSDRQARIAELKLFGGLSAQEIGEALGISKRSVELDWKMAKAWLTRRLAP
ncbi:MAG: ECF-type sigma factor [Planctomycetota bacterium]